MVQGKGVEQNRCPRMKKKKSKKARAGPMTKSVDRQVHQYDKILRENLEAALPGLAKRLLDIHAVYSEELPDDVQHTKERKPDVLKKVTDRNGETFVLHIEWQTTDEKEMVFRMAEYFYMLWRRYQLPVRQYVIYIGEGIPTMADHIHCEQAGFAYNLIALSSIDYRLLLEADTPQEKILAILANFGNSDSQQAVKTIVKEVVAASDGEFATLRHIQQLQILSQLRIFEPENIAFMESVATWWKLERDPFYRLGEWRGMEKGIEKGIERGIEKGQEKERRALVKALLLKTNHTISEIALLVNVSEALVRKVKKSLQP
jgi:predicted transposase/invertase (TIGR01784 family)